MGNSILRASVVMFLLLTAPSCGGSDDADGGNGGSSGGSGGTGGNTTNDSGTGGSFLDAAPAEGSVQECDDNVRPVYVLARDEAHGTIHRFEPDSLTFESVAAVDCPETQDWGVSSMAIDRSYGAWIEWGGLHDGPDDPYPKRLDRIDLATGVCSPNQGKLPTVEQWGSPLGMAFVTDTSGGSAERLFFVDTSTRVYGLGGTEAIGRFYDGGGLTFSGVELSGTGGGRLFMLIMNWTPEWDHPCTAENPCYPTVHLGEVNKNDGTAISNVELPDVPAMGISSGGFAFAHWGGHFWVFISKDFGPTHVYDYDPVADLTVLAKSDGPDGVVGAGVSTCAPLEMPK